ncbi:MAG: protein phosphatase 2C domain-containing protein [Pseudomonadota bacterium]
MTPAGFDVGHGAILGAREAQEDEFRVSELTSDGAVSPIAGDGPFTRVLVALADGMGGHAAGEVAAEITSRVFTEVAGDKLCDAPAGSDDAETWQASSSDALAAANRDVADYVKAHPNCDGMGATLIGALFSPSGLSWISIGDSPMFLIRNREIARVNADHSLAPVLDDMARAGELTREAARRDPRRHMLRAAITGETLDLVDQSARPLELAPDDIVICASDGIETLADDEIMRVAVGYRADGAKAVAEALLRSVENANVERQDNASVVVVIPWFRRDA